MVVREFTGEVRGLSHEGRGVVQREGKVVFVDNALPKEQVRVWVQRKKRQYEEGIALEYQNAHPHRVKPQCEYAQQCGGCSLQHISPAFQIEHKFNVLREQLYHFGRLEPVDGFMEPVVGPVFGYRRKARLACKYVKAKDRVLLGFREKNNHFVADIQACQVLDPRIGKTIDRIQHVLGQLTIKDKIPQIEVAIGDNAVALIVRHLEPLESSDQFLLQTLCQSLQFELYLQPSGLSTVHKVWPEETHERLVYRIESLGMKYQFHPLDFVQVNSVVNEKLINLALDLLEISDRERVLDLYCGLGNFALPMGLCARSVMAVEVSLQMVDRGKENAALNGLTNVEFVQCDLSQPFKDQSWWGVYDKVLLDPPRSGAQSVVEHISKTQAKRVVYVSCNPATLARDIQILQRTGYRLLTAGVLDMFPHTAHVESIAVCQRDA